MEPFCLTYFFSSVGFSLALIGISVPRALRGGMQDTPRLPAIHVLATGLAIGLLVGWVISSQMGWRVACAEELVEPVSDAIETIESTQKMASDMKLGLVAEVKTAVAAESTLREVDGLLVHDSIWHLRLQGIDTWNLRCCLDDLDDAYNRFVLAPSASDVGVRYLAGGLRARSRSPTSDLAFALKRRLTDLRERLVNWRALLGLVYATLLGAPLTGLGLAVLVLLKRTYP